MVLVAVTDRKEIKDGEGIGATSQHCPIVTDRIEIVKSNAIEVVRKLRKWPD